MKFNWGTGIMIFFILFALSMITAVVATTRYPPQMVQKDYYALDLGYQDRLEKKQNAASLAVLPEVRFNSATKNIEVKFPEGMTAESGQIKFFRSATTKEDVVTQLEHNTFIEIPAAGFTSGRWHAELDWNEAAGTKYFCEAVLQIP